MEDTVCSPEAALQRPSDVAQTAAKTLKYLAIDAFYLQHLPSLKLLPQTSSVCL